MALDVNGNITINWDCDCNDQAAVVSTLLADINSQNTIIQSAFSKQIQIFSKTQPSTAQWQTQWLLRGNTLPMPNGVECLWFDTTLNTYGAQYYTINGIPYPVEMKMYRGIESVKVVPDSLSLFGTTLNTSAAGLTHWDTTGGSPQAASVIFNIPTHLIGKSYFVKFYIPISTQADTNLNWTIWYENTNFYNTLYGGAGEAGFGRIPSTGTGYVKASVIEWMAEIPAGGVQTTIAVRIAIETTPVSIVSIWPSDGGGTGLNLRAGSGKLTAEFILKTE